MNRICIVVDKTMSAGHKANVAAILTGQLAKDVPKLYETSVNDKSDVIHTGIAANVIVLDGGREQLLTLINNIKNSEVKYSVFSSIGQSLSNDYTEYRYQISAMDTRTTCVIGVGIAGEDSTVRFHTKKFSLMK